MIKLFVSYVAQNNNKNFYGDCVMRFYGVPKSEDDVEVIRAEIKRDLKSKGHTAEHVLIQNWIVMAQ